MSSYPPDARSAPLHLRPSSWALVFLGGALGTLARALLGLWIPDLGAPAGTALPLGLLACNLLGAFCLGLLLEHLARSGPDEGARRAVRLGVGTGAMGGFTSYSALALAVAGPLAHPAASGDPGAWTASIGYGLASVIAGLAAAAAGIALSARHGARTAPIVTEETP